MKDYASLKEYMLNSDDFKLILTPYIAETIAADNISDKLRFSKFSALQKLAGALLRFQNENINNTLICSIAKKKANMIVNASSCTKISQIISPKAPYFDGIRYIPSPYLTEEEEYICWCKVGEKFPLGHNETKRVFELFEILKQTTFKDKPFPEI